MDCSVVKSRPGNPGKLSIYRNEIKFLSSFANPNGTCYISFIGTHMHIQVVSLEAVIRSLDWILSCMVLDNPGKVLGHKKCTNLGAWWTLFSMQ